METRFNLNLVGFLSSLRSKMAHTTCQIRATSCKGRKIKFLKRFDLNLKRNIFTLKKRSFFILFTSNSCSINTQHIDKDKERNPSPWKQPYFSQIFPKLANF